tara:strand:- start:673 stop:1089 length:417 start_codon:yes stop_codon:yes gene_type:complete
MALYKLNNNPLTGKIDSVYKNLDNPPHSCIPIDEANIDYQQYLQDIKDAGMSIVSCDDCGDGVPNDTMWQYLDNAEQLIHDKYHSDPSLHDKITALREHKYVRAMKAEFPYKSMTDAGPIIDSTSKEIKQKYNLPPRI